MKMVPIETVRLAELTPQAKARLPVSTAIDAKGNRVIISRFEDDVWNFWPYITRENSKDGNKRIIWGILLPDGLKLTDAKHRRLLESAKNFIWSLYVNPIEGVKRPAMNTLISMASTMTFLLRWMVSQSIDQFSQLAGRTSEFILAVRNSGNISKSTVKRRLSMLEKLYAQAGKIDDFLPEHPWPFESATVLAGIDQRMSHRLPLTSVIPDDVFICLAKKAIEYIDDRADDILRVHAEVEQAMDSARKRGVTGRAYIFGFGREVARMHGYGGLREFNTDMSMLKTACYICINMFSGLRNSEMMSLDSNCITKTLGIDGSYECIWLHGTIYKSGVRPHKWLVPPIVERAIKLAERLCAPLQGTLFTEAQQLKKRLANSSMKINVSDAKRLGEIERIKTKLFLSIYYGKRGPSVDVASNASVNKWLKDFCKHCNIRDADDNPWALATHQFRRTFAYNYARSELGDLLYLRDHYGHWSLDMTVLYADGGADEYQVDNGLLEDIVRAKQERQAEILATYIDTDAALANGEDWLGAWRPMVRTAKNKEELIRELSDTLTLNGTGHSWCAGNAKGGNCGGLCVFEADMCVDCNTGIIGPEHLPVWRAIAEQQRVVLDLSDMGAPAKGRAKRILAKANQVISRLDAMDKNTI